MKFLKQTTYIFNSKAIKICPDQHADLHGILFIKDYLKITKGLEVSRPHFSLILHKTGQI